MAFSLESNLFALGAASVPGPVFSISSRSLLSQIGRFSPLHVVPQLVKPRPLDAYLPNSVSPKKFEACFAMVFSVALWSGDTLRRVRDISVCREYGLLWLFKGDLTQWINGEY